MYRVAINIDEVLVEFLKPMAQHNKLKLPSKPRYSYVYRNIFDLSEEESTKMVRDFYVQMMRPKISKIYAITGRQKCVRHKTEDWLDDMILPNSYTPRQVCKADISHSFCRVRRGNVSMVLRRRNQCDKLGGNIQKESTLDS